MSNRRWLTVADIRKQQRMRRETVINAMLSGELPYEQRGRIRYARRCDVERNVSTGWRQLPVEFSVASVRKATPSALRWGPAPKPPGFFEAWLGCSKGVVTERFLL